jgi:ribonuclease D
MTPSDYLVEDSERLEEICSGLRRAGAVALDTEFHSERRFWPELFLVQVADAEGAWAIDPVACTDLSPLAGLVTDPGVIKVMHSSRNDIAILRRSLGVEFSGVFDTQLAAAFLGYGEQSSLYSLLQDVCGIKAKKAFCLSDWSRRPLAVEQVEYALDDVRHLLQLYEKLSSELRRKKRMEWYELEARSLADPAGYEVSLPEIYRRARSSGKIKKSGYPVLWALVRWRERKVMELDRPRGHLAADSLLARLAMMSPTSMDSLERLRGMPSGFVSKWGEEVLTAVREALDSQPADVPEIATQRLDGGASARADILRIYVKQKAHHLRIAPSLLLPREAMDRLATMPRSEARSFLEGPDLAGWRRDAIGEELAALLSGKLALCMGSTPSGGLRFVKVG